MTGPVIGPRELDALYAALLRASCDCPHDADGHSLECVPRGDGSWYRLGACVMCPCPGGRSANEMRRQLRLVNGRGDS